MQLDHALGKTFFGKECGNLESLVALELDNLTHLLVIDESSVTGELL